MDYIMFTLKGDSWVLLLNCGSCDYSVPFFLAFVHIRKSEIAHV